MKAIYAFSGDPITFGHIDIVERAARTYAEVVVAIGENPRKSGRYTFARADRLAMAERALSHLPNVTCEVFDGLLAEHAYRHGIDVIVRGVRNAGDLDNELIQFAVNESLHPSLDTVFLPTRYELAHISSSVVKAIVIEGGDVSSYCPLHVKEALERRLLHRYAVGIAGGIAGGKTTLSEALAAELEGSGQRSTRVSLDRIGHHVLSKATDPIYQQTRARIIERFGPEVGKPDGSISRRALGRIVFADGHALEELNAIMREPMLARLYEETHDLPSGIVLIEGAILVEGGWSKLVNNNVILVDAPVDERVARMCRRDDIGEIEAKQKIDRQVSPEARRQLLQDTIDVAGWGHIWDVSTSGLGRDGQADGNGSFAEKVAELAAGIVAHAKLPISQD
jgi:pantetheine-phosphate adenylyltransferase